ncbi:Hypothetical predicted protein [Podarcis lilfordi]|uniref:Uncharacterized protein n=1 Tax=Podarcis lilfordi TaxID=74358 RepID=A0AA35JS22_9SAUR|nr:Hypothetical predicted protein [Podarcis lilfordi]
MIFRNLQHYCKLIWGFLCQAVYLSRSLQHIYLYAQKGSHLMLKKLIPQHALAMATGSLASSPVVSPESSGSVAFNQLHVSSCNKANLSSLKYIEQVARSGSKNNRDAQLTFSRAVCNPINRQSCQKFRELRALLSLRKSRLAVDEICFM